MKGKQYTPSHPYSEFYDIDLLGDYNTFKYPIKSKTIKKFKVNTREFSPIRYMWKTSVPANWFKLASPNRFIDIRLENLKNRNTLQFLEETQKYIYHIRKPLAPRNALKFKKDSRSKMTGTQSVPFLSTRASEKKDINEFYLTSFKTETSRVRSLIDSKHTPGCMSAY